MGTSLYSPFPSLPLQLLLVPAPRSSAISYADCFWFLWLSLNWLFPQVLLLTFLRPFATQGSHALKDCFILTSVFFGSHFWSHEYRGCATITRGLAIYSWRAPGIQEAPFATQRPLRHAALGMITHTVAWGVPFGRPRDKSVCLRASPPCDLSPPTAAR